MAAEVFLADMRTKKGQSMVDKVAKLWRRDGFQFLYLNYYSSV